MGSSLSPVSAGPTHETRYPRLYCPYSLQELFGAPGVSLVVTYLQFDSAIFASSPHWQLLLLAAVECSWCRHGISADFRGAIVGCATTEAIFLSREGAFLLLDALQRCPAPMRPSLLGALCDFTEVRHHGDGAHQQRPGVMAHVMAWRGEGDRTAASLCLELWRVEEQQLAVGSSSGFLAGAASLISNGQMRRCPLQARSSGDNLWLFLRGVWRLLRFVLTSPLTH
jgi:hypothetical protein